MQLTPSFSLLDFNSYSRFDRNISCISKVILNGSVVTRVKIGIRVAHPSECKVGKNWVEWILSPGGEWMLPQGV